MFYSLRDFLRTGSLAVLLYLVAPSATWAQQLPGILSGTVRDSVSRQPVPYATVVLLPAVPNASQLAGTTTDAQGLFTLPKVGPGSFRLQVSFVGYAPHTRAVLMTAATTTLPPILLAPT
ncbi:MAG: carboxypeptidase-like regulatory domain-containing protein, partial [Hymenobacter sp.]